MLLLLGRFVGISGLFEHAQHSGSYMYIGEGFIGWGPRVRLMSWPEQTVVVLRNADKIPAPLTSMRAAQTWGYIAIAAFALSFAFVLFTVILPSAARFASFAQQKLL